MQNKIKKSFLYLLVLFCYNTDMFAQNNNKWNLSQNEIDSIYEMVMKSPNLLIDFVNDSVTYEKCLYAISQEEVRFKNQLIQMKHREDSMLNIVYDQISCRFFLNGKEIELSDNFEVYFVVDLLNAPYKIKSLITKNSFSYPICHRDSNPILFIFKYNDVFLYSLENNGVRQNNNVCEYVIKVESNDDIATKNGSDYDEQLLSFSIAYNRPCSNCSCVNLHYTFIKKEYETYYKYLKNKHLKKKQIVGVLRYLGIEK